jgi:P27 family predicted phage terminase small subunit
MGVITVIDRAVLAAYCQAWGRWVEAEEKLKETPLLIRTPSGYIQQSPWLSVSNRQMELMGRYMAELGLTPAARSRIVVAGAPTAPEPLTIQRIIISGPRQVQGAGEGPPPDEDGIIVISCEDANI